MEGNYITDIHSLSKFTSNTLSLKIDNLFQNDVTFKQDVNINGNFSVNGTTTTINTESYSAEKLELIGNNDTPILKITELSEEGNIIEIYKDSEPVIILDNLGKLITSNITVHEDLTVKGNINDVTVSELGNLKDTNDNIQSQLDNKQGVLTAGSGINISGDTISVELIQQDTFNSSNINSFNINTNKISTLDQTPVRVYPPTHDFTYDGSAIEGRSSLHYVSGKEYGNGTYKVTMNHHMHGYRLFTDAENWSPGQLHYGGYIGSGFGATDANGLVDDFHAWWVTLELPYGIFIKRFEISNASSETLKIFKIYGSKNGIEWDELFYSTQIMNWDADGRIGSDIETYELYKYFGFALNDVGSKFAQSATFGSWYIYGSEKKDLEIDTGLNMRGNLTVEGYLAVYGTVPSSFTGNHICESESLDIYDKKYIGYIVSSAKKYKSINSKYDPQNIKQNIDKENNDCLPLIELTSKQNDPNIFGVITQIEEQNETMRRQTTGGTLSIFKKELFDRRLLIAGCGEGFLWVSDYNGPLYAGDLISSSPIPGISMKQDDTLLRNYTVAKITMDCDFNPAYIPIKVFHSIDENGEYIYENQLDDNGNIMYDYEYEMKYIKLDGTITDADDYATGNNVYRMALVGSCYKCS